MLRLDQLKIPINEDQEAALVRKASKLLRVNESDVKKLSILRRSIDARDKENIFYVYNVSLLCEIAEKKIRSGKKISGVSIYEPKEYKISQIPQQKSKKRPVVVGAGPAGLFAAYALCLAGCPPILLERGRPVEKRTEDVKRFWETGVLDTSSNVQFGEGGAGAFSDGKLNTLIKDRDGSMRFVLESFVHFGAPEEILFDYKPHIGTDVLTDVIKNMRLSLLDMGCDIRFETTVTKVLLSNEQVKGVRIRKSLGAEDEISCDKLILAIGHSARDTFYSLHETKIPMQAKEFAVGFRIEHPRAFIDEHQFGTKGAEVLGAAPYKLATKLKNGRGVYSFCMCPGGFVVPSSSGPDEIVVNGMSAAARNSKWSNAAIVVEIRPEDIPQKFHEAAEKLGCPQLAGLLFRSEIEGLAFTNGKGQAAPAQRLTDFLANRVSSELPASSYTAGLVSSNLASWLPAHISDRLKKGFAEIDRSMHGFICPEALMIAAETRTSTPVRILRDKQTFECTALSGLYPVGEGSGYSGGIVSSAMDGENACSQIINRII